MMPKLWSDAFKNKFVLPDQLEELVLKLKKEKKTIATLNGSFDLLHAGHLHIIYEASKQADCLIVALNSDASIKKYKSEKRPFVPLQDRLQMMAALEFVDYVTCFEETDPCALLEKIKPDVHVNGAEYGEDCLESKIVKQHGGKIHIVKLVPGLSTTQIIEKIQNSCV